MNYNIKDKNGKLLDGIYCAKIHEGYTCYIVRFFSGISEECIRIDSSVTYAKTSNFWEEWGTYELASMEAFEWLQKCIAAGTLISNEIPKKLVGEQSESFKVGLLF